MSSLIFTASVNLHRADISQGNFKRQAFYLLDYLLKISSANIVAA